MKLIHGKKLEHYLVEIMIDESCTLAEALDIMFLEQGVDIKSVFDLVDFLEDHLESLDNVATLMGIYTGKEPDLELGNPTNFKDII